MPVDHIGFPVPASKLDDFVKFLEGALKPIDLVECWRPIPTAVGMSDGKGGRPYFWPVGVAASDASEEALLRVTKLNHLCFHADSKEKVHEFYEAAMKLGAKDNGPPGPRAHYGQNYYAAFVVDPFCGVNLEVVYRGEQ